MATQLQLTLAASGQVFTLSESQIIYVNEDTLGSAVTYINERDGSKLVSIVSETKSAIDRISTRLMAVTLSNGSTPLVNIDRMNVKDRNSTGAYFEYDQEGATNIVIQTTDSFGEFMDTLLTTQGETVYEFDDVNATNDTISLAAAEGDLTSTFVNGVYFTAFGSTTATVNTIWSVSSSAWSGGKQLLVCNHRSLE